MKTLRVVAMAILFGSLAGNLLAAETVTKTSGGLMKIDVGYGIYINEESTVAREWITVHDDSIPADIMGTVGPRIAFGERQFEFVYKSAYTIVAKEPLAAVEVRFLLFDIWGEHSRNLSAVAIVDMEAGEAKEFDGTWNIYPENEAYEHYASISYVARARARSGRVFTANPKLILKQARKFSNKFSEENLEPTPVKQ